MDKRKTFMDVHQTLDWVNAFSEAESDGGEVSGLSDVTWVVNIRLPGNRGLGGLVECCDVICYFE